MIPNVRRCLLVLALQVLIFIGTQASMELKNLTACYGITGLANFLQPSCPGGQKIAVRALYTLAKYKSSGCPQEQTTSAIDPSCCEYDVNDCSYFYDLGSYRAYYQSCNGESSCTIPVSWIDLPTYCNKSVYIERTHYMKMDYYCISDQALDPCSDLTTTDSPAFFWNAGFPSEMTSAITSCSCSIELSCETTVQITALDLNFKDVGNCKQSMEITDDSLSVTLDCSSNNDYLPKVLYTSSGHFITINFVNNLGTTGGKFFIQIQGLNPTGQITLSCGTSALSTPSVAPSSLAKCPIDGETTSTNSTDQSTTILTSTAINSTLTSTTSISTTVEISTINSTLLSTESSAFSSTDNSTESTTDTSNISTIISTISTDTSSINVDTTLNDNVTLYSTESATNLSLSTFNTSDMTPEFTTLSWVSTENYSTAPTDVNVTSCCSQPSHETEDTPVYIIVVVILVVILAVGALILFYKDRIKECCCAKKTKGDVEDNNNEINPVFQVNLSEHSKFQALPPIRHEFKMKTDYLDNPTPITREHGLFLKAQKRQNNIIKNRLSEKSWNTGKSEQIKPENIQKKKIKPGKKIKEVNFERANNLQTGDLSKGERNSGTGQGQKQKGRKTKWRKRKGNRKVAQKDDVIDDMGTNSSVPNSTLGVTSPSTARRSSVSATIDIVDDEGQLEKSVLIDNVVEDLFSGNMTNEYQ
ncbi:uncharacterized protein LOC134257716 [Saccostrea cucullata]|uniref:uncharacterized protein LOC134257716 n=1 Tax=Saccostrea cuccullata TaxID=36930 RepID=UPI002ED2266B